MHEKWQQTMIRNDVCIRNEEFSCVFSEFLINRDIVAVCDKQCSLIKISYHDWKIIEKWLKGHWMNSSILIEKTNTSPKVFCI